MLRSCVGSGLRFGAKLRLRVKRGFEIRPGARHEIWTNFRIEIEIKSENRIINMDRVGAEVRIVIRIRTTFIRTLQPLFLIHALNLKQLESIACGKYIPIFK